MALAQGVGVLVGLNERGVLAGDAGQSDGPTQVGTMPVAPGASGWGRFGGGSGVTASWGVPRRTRVAVECRSIDQNGEGKSSRPIIGHGIGPYSNLALAGSRYGKSISGSVIWTVAAAQALHLSPHWTGSSKCNNH
jgi:hypothetical protein